MPETESIICTDELIHLINDTLKSDFTRDSSIGEVAAALAHHLYDISQGPIASDCIGRRAILLRGRKLGALLKTIPTAAPA